MIAWLINDDALADMKVSFGWAEITVTSETSHCVTQGCNSFCEWVNIKIKNTHTEHLTELRWSVISTVSMLSDSGISTLSEWSSCKLSHSRQYLLNCHMLVSGIPCRWRSNWQVYLTSCSHSWWSNDVCGSSLSPSVHLIYLLKVKQTCLSDLQQVLLTFSASPVPDNSQINLIVWRL